MYKKQNNHIEVESLVFLLREMRRYKWYGIALPFIACIAQVSLSVITILIPKIVLDAVAQKVFVERLFMQIIVVGIIHIILVVINMISHNKIISYSQSFLYSKLTTIWEKKCISLDYDVLISNEGKMMMEKAREAISSPNWGIVEFLNKETDVLENLTGLIVYVGIVGHLHPVIICFLAFIFAIEVVWGIQIEKKKQGLKGERAKAGRRINYVAYATKGIKEAKDIRIYSLGTLLRQISQMVVKDKRIVEEKEQRLQFYHLLVTALLILFRDSVAYMYLIYLYINGRMSVGDFTLYFASITGIGNWLTKLSDAISAYIETNNYVVDFYKFMKLSDTEKNQDKRVRIGENISFEFRNVSFSYLVEVNGEKRKVPVIKNLNFTIKGGEKIAVVGINGAGKTTFIKLLCGMLKPDCGSIFVNGFDSSKMSRNEYFALFSAVFQKSQILPISIADNIMLNIKEEKDKEEMWKCICMAGLEEKVKSLPEEENTCLVKQMSEEGVELSGGEEQKLFLARALYKNAPVLILDEPTAALDPIAENDIYQKYNQFTENKTAVFVSHRLSSTRFCDKIIFMENGEILECGTHQELMKLSGKYAAMFQVQSKYYQNEDRDGDIE